MVAQFESVGVYSRKLAALSGPQQQVEMFHFIPKIQSFPDNQVSWTLLANTSVWLTGPLYFNFFFKKKEIIFFLHTSW